MLCGILMLRREVTSTGRGAGGGVGTFLTEKSTWTGLSSYLKKDFDLSVVIYGHVVGG
jgi:hypothetical protein